MATLAIGDIHGCFDSLRRLLDRLDLDGARDRLWLVGDLVGRGPCSLEVLRWAASLEAEMGDRLVCVLGNHDVRLLAVAAGAIANRSRFGLDEILRAPDRGTLLGWLSRRSLFHRQGEWALVHAGLLPSWSLERAQEEARKAEALLRTREGLAAMLASPERSPGLALKVFTSLRTCTRDERLCDFAGPPPEAPPGCHPWFELPGQRGRGVTVLIGHWAAMGLRIVPGLAALDTGAAWGGRLTAMRLEDGRITQEPALETRSLDRE